MQLSSDAPSGQLPARALQTRLTLPSHTHVGTSGKSSLSVGTSGKSPSSLRLPRKRPPMHWLNDNIKRQKASRSPLSQEKDDHEIQFKLEADTSKFTLDHRLKLDDLEQRDMKFTSKRVASGKRDVTVTIHCRTLKHKLKIDNSLEMEILCDVSIKSWIFLNCCCCCCCC